MFTFCSMAIAGGMPSIASTSGFVILPRNCLAYDERLSANRRCPSAKSVSNASEDLPEPDIPVITTNLPRGISTVIFLRLLTFAPRMTMFPSSDISLPSYKKLKTLHSSDDHNSDKLAVFVGKDYKNTKKYLENMKKCVPLHPQSGEAVAADKFGAVVQLVRTPACHAGGRGFESLPHRSRLLNEIFAGESFVLGIIAKNGQNSQLRRRRRSMRRGLSFREVRAMMTGVPSGRDAGTDIVT